LGIAVIGTGAALFAGAATGTTALGLAQGVKTGLSGSVEFPVTCGMNQEITIVGRKFEGEGTLITGDINCKIKIKDSTLKADVVVLAKNLVEISVENSRLEGKEAAVKLGMNSKLFASRNTSLKGEESGVAGGINSEVTLTDSSVDGGETGLKADVNFKLQATNSRISGKEYGIRGSSNFDLEGKQLTVLGNRAAIEGEVNLKARLRGGLIEGGQIGIHTKGPNTKLELSRGARIKAREVALKTGSNLEIDMEDAEIDGGEQGIETDVNPKLNLGPKARIHGTQLAIKAGVNLELQMRSATLDSESVALCAPFNIEVQARDSTIRGGSDAFRFQRRPNQLELIQTNVSGLQLFTARGCSASKP
jgi:hypothetical protein